MLSIKLTEVADLKCQDIPGHKTNLTSPLFIEVPVSSQESDWSCICVLYQARKVSGHACVLYQARKVSGHVYVCYTKPGK